MEIQRSNCGDWDYDRLSSLIRKGWRTVGDVAYCPKCVPHMRFTETESKSLSRLADRVDDELSDLKEDIYRRLNPDE